MSNFQLIKQFHEKFDPINADEPLDALLPRRLAYMFEEFQEAAEAADKLFAAADPTQPQSPETVRQLKAEVVKELTDILHVTYGFLHLLQVDADAAFAEVHKSNMSKTPNPGGKAVKDDSYTPAEMEKFV